MRESFVRSWIDSAAVILVAEVVERDGDCSIVAEAGYSPLPNGNGELALTVDAAYRGWLSLWLLDALVAEAAERDVPNLEALMLADNREMQAMMHHRGDAAMHQNEWETLRLVIGTTGSTPSWPEGHDRARLLVEAPRTRWSAADHAEGAGFDVMVCRGPDAHRSCPLTRGERCRLVEGADVVIFDLPHQSELLDAHLAGEIPVVIQRGDSIDAAEAAADEAARVVEDRTIEADPGPEPDREVP